MANIKKILPTLIDSGDFTIIGDLQVSGTILQSGSVFSASDTGLAANLATTGQTLDEDISSNADNISTNTSNISTNTSSISTNASNLVTTGQTLQTQITSNDSDISTLTANLVSTGSTLDAKIDTLSGVVALDSETGSHVTTSMTGDFATRTIQESFSQGLNVGTSNDLANRKLHVVGDIEVSGTIYQSGSVFEGGGGGGSSTFTGLADTPSSFTAGKYLTVNSAGTAIEMTNSIQSGFATSDQELFTELTLAGATTGIVQNASGTISNLDLADNKWDVSIVEETDSQLVTGDANWTDVSLLLPFDGANAATSTTDESDTGHTVTFNGNVQISTAQSKWGGSSLLFDGSGDYLTLGDSSDWTFGTADFTIEFWVRFTTLSGTQRIYTAVSDSSGFIRMGWSSTAWELGGTSSSQTFSDSLSVDTWYHVAFVRTSGVVKVFRDGTQKGSDYANTTNFNPLNGVYIGKEWGSGSSYFSGYFDDFRVTKGVARYTSSFTPPTAAFYTSASVNITETKYISQIGGWDDTDVDYGIKKISNSELSVKKMGADVRPIDRLYVNVQKLGAVGQGVAFNQLYTGDGTTTNYLLTDSVSNTQEDRKSVV